MIKNKPLLLDLYCGAGGSAMGYNRAGFDIIGVDINKQPNFPFEFIQEDAITYATKNYLKFDAIHASPPCQAYTRKNYNWGRSRTYHYDHPDLLEPTRSILTEIGLPYVIENLPEAPMNGSLTLCGTMFGLKITKHRIFEANWPLPLLVPISCNHTNTYNPWSGSGRSAEKLREAQGTPWIPSSGGASRKEGRTGDLFNAIPPAYTEFIGSYLLSYLRSKNAE
jgi:DNA (cytosine-5)-methyltransferase 1